MLCLPTFQGVATVFADRTEHSAYTTYAVSTESRPIEAMDNPREKCLRPQPLEDLEPVVISRSHQDQSIQVGKNLSAPD